MDRSVEPKRKSKEKRERVVTPGSREWYERIDEDEPRTDA